MSLPDLREKWTSQIVELTIGATSGQGGTREKTVTVGGQTTLPFMTDEGSVPHRPAIAGFVSDIVPDWPGFVHAAIGKEIADPVEWAQKSVELSGVDLINLKFLGADPVHGDRKPDECARVVERILKAVKVPLVIWGCGNDEKDNNLLPECARVSRGENCLIGPARESNYKTVVAICKADKHKVIAEAPVDINLGKQIVILLQLERYRDVPDHGGPRVRAGLRVHDPGTRQVKRPQR
jgi:acetyl-CoA decarbonylase/synthase complex subunit delta